MCMEYIVMYTCMHFDFNRSQLMYLLNGTVIINLIELLKNEKKACKNPNCSHNPSALRKRKSLLSKWHTQQFEDQYTHYTKKVNIEPCMHICF